MNNIGYIHPDFQEMLDSVPQNIGLEVDLSFSIAARIYHILERKGWSQADFARAAGKKEAEISKWMSGQHNFTIRTIAFIEMVLGEKILAVKQFRSQNVTEYSKMQHHASSGYSTAFLNKECGRPYSRWKRGETRRKKV